MSFPTSPTVGQVYVAANGERYTYGADGVWAAAAGAAAVATGLTYSTTEEATGEFWIDGKPIYRKVVYVTNVYVSGSMTAIDGTITTAYVDKLIRIGGYFKDANNVVPIGAWTAGDAALFISPVVGLTVGIASSYSATNVVYAVIEYTKA